MFFSRLFLLVYLLRFEAIDLVLSHLLLQAELSIFGLFQLELAVGIL